MSNKLLIDSLILLDDSGMPQAPTIRQIVDRDVKELYKRDKSTDKKRYISECIVIYYLGDPKSPARQSGLSEREALAYAIEQAGLDKGYIPDSLVLRLIKRYEDENLTEAGRVVENILQTIHNVNLLISHLNKYFNDQLAKPTLSGEELSVMFNNIAAVKKEAGDIPSILKKLEEAKQNLMYEQETELSRGGNAVLSSMDAEDN